MKLVIISGSEDFAIFYLEDFLNNRMVFLFSKRQNLVKLLLLRVFCQLGIQKSIGTLLIFIAILFLIIHQT